MKRSRIVCDAVNRSSTGPALVLFRGHLANSDSDARRWCSDTKSYSRV